MFSQTPSILVVDDDADIRTLCRRVLEMQGYRVSTAASGYAAIAAAHRASFDLLLLDIKLPGLDGFETFQAIRQFAPQIPAVVITGYGGTNTAIQALKLGVSDFVPKPFKATALARIVSEVLAKERSARERARLAAVRPLMDLCQTLTPPVNWERLLLQLVKLGSREGQADQASLMLWDHSEQALIIKAAFNLPQTAVATTRKKAGEMIAGWVFQTRRPLLLRDEIPLDAQIKQSMRRPEIASALCIPLGVRDRAVGVMNLNTLRGNPPLSASDLTITSLLCNQAAVAIENVYLSERLAAVEHLRLSEERFLSPRVAQTITAGRSTAGTLDAERRMTVLFADICGYARLAEKIAAPTLVTLLNEYFEAMTDIIIQHQGVVDEFSGDAILATFESSMSQGEDARQAVRAGLAMRAKLKTLQIDWSKRGLPVFDIGIGISTGMITTGCIGSAKRMALVTTGKSINIASRSEKLTKEFRVPLIITQSTFEQVENLVVYRELGPVVLDGLAETVRLYGIYGLKSPVAIKRS